MSPPPTQSSLARKRKGDTSLSAQEPTSKRRRRRRIRHTECVVHHHPPRISVPPGLLQQQVTLDMIAELLHFAALGRNNGAPQPSWCHLHHQKDIKGVNIVVLDGLTQCLFYKHFLTLQHLRTKYTTRLTFTPSATNLPSGIFSSEVPESVSSCFAQRDQESNQLRDVLRLHPVIRKFGTAVKGLTAYTLTHEEMIKKHFPVRGVGGFEDFISTESADYVADSSPLYGLDCEMCFTAKGYELTRVSLVDSGGRCVLDELVQPPNPILNYLTRFSGITAAMLRPISTMLSDVQAKLLSLLPPDAVLVGHSLDNDLRALKLIHPHVIDTSLLYMKELGQKFKLKVLAETVLAKQIQTEEQIGHDPAEDASAALELAQYFIKAGPQQVVERHCEELWGESVTVPKPPDVQPTPSTRFADVLQRSGQSVSFVGKRADVTLNPSNQQWHSSDREVLASFRRQAAWLSFSVVQFSSFSDHVKRSQEILQQERHHHRLRAHLRRMCAVFAGPFPPAFGQQDVTRLFRRCGSVKRVNMLPTAHRIHAEIEFRRLEGAVLAVDTLNGHSVACGQHIQVQRPVNESTLDLDLTLDALKEDPANVNRVHVTRLMPYANDAHADAYNNGKMAFNGTRSMNGHDQLGLQAPAPAACTALSEEDLTEVFGRFGAVEGIVRAVKRNGRPVSRHASITFQSPDGVAAALASAEELRSHGYLVCPSLTPDHLRSWAPGGHMETEDEVANQEEFSSSSRSLMENHLVDGETERVMKKLDRHLRKLFKSLPDHTLSVVVLPGHTSSTDRFPGLCFMEVKDAVL